MKVEEDDPPLPTPRTSAARRSSKKLQLLNERHSQRALVDSGEFVASTREVLVRARSDDHETKHDDTIPTAVVFQIQAPGTPSGSFTATGSVETSEAINRRRSSAFHSNVTGVTGQTDSSHSSFQNQRVMQFSSSQSSNFGDQGIPRVTPDGRCNLVSKLIPSNSGYVLDAWPRQHIRGVEVIHQSKVVVKLAAKRDVRTRLANERVKLQELPPHRGVVALMDQDGLPESRDEKTGSVFLPMLCEDMDFMQFRRQHSTRLTVPALRNLTRQLVDAVYHCHSNNLYHLSLSPQCLWVDSLASHLIMSNFGISQLIIDEEPLVCVADLSASSPSSSPPEVTQHACDDEVCVRGCVDPSKVDVWSLGVCVYVMWVGVHPWSTASHASTDYKTFERERALPEQRPSVLPVELRTWLMCLLEVDPAKRCTVKYARDWLQRIGWVSSKSNIQSNVQSRGFEDLHVGDLAPVSSGCRCTIM